MPNIRSSSVGAAGISVTASDNAAVTITVGWIQSQINNLAGSDQTLLQQTVERRIAEQIASVLGESNCLADQISVTVDLGTGIPTDLGFTN